MRNGTIAAALVVSGLLSLGGKATAGASPGMGNRMVLLTYWGDDEIALVDINGAPGKEKIFNLNVLQKGCSKPYDIKVNAERSVAYATCSGICDGCWEFSSQLFGASLLAIPSSLLGGSEA